MRIHVPIHMRWSDLDAYGHVNNATMLTLLEEARVRALWANPDEAGDGDDAAASTEAIFAGGAAADTFTLIARQEIEYLVPIPHMQKPLDVELWVGRIGGSSADICYEIYSPEGNSPRTLFAQATTVLVLVDATTGRSRRLSENERARLTNILEDPISHRR